MKKVFKARCEFMERVGIANIDEVLLVSFFVGEALETLDDITYARTKHPSLFDFVYSNCRDCIEIEELRELDMLDILRDA